MSKWDIREVNIPRLPPIQARWQEDGTLVADYSFTVDHKIIATWNQRGTWASPEDVYEVISKIRTAHYVREEDIVIYGGWPETGDRIMGIEMP
jgi:hypothetical protein